MCGQDDALQESVNWDFGDALEDFVCVSGHGIVTAVRLSRVAEAFVAKSVCWWVILIFLGRQKFYFNSSWAKNFVFSWPKEFLWSQNLKKIIFSTVEAQKEYHVQRLTEMGLFITTTTPRMTTTTTTTTTTRAPIIRKTTTTTTTTTMAPHTHARRPPSSQQPSSSVAVVILFFILQIRCFY